MHKPRQMTRLLQVTIPREAYVLLGKLIQARVEKDFAPSKATKSAVMTDAITKMAIAEGLAEETPPEQEHAPKGKPFEIVPLIHSVSANDSH